MEELPPGTFQSAALTAAPSGAANPPTQDLSKVIAKAEDTVVALNGTVTQGIPTVNQDAYNPDHLASAVAPNGYFIVQFAIPGISGSDKTGNFAALIKSAANKYDNWTVQPGWTGEPGATIDRATGWKYKVADIPSWSTDVLEVIAFPGDVIEIQVMVGGDTLGWKRGDSNSVSFNGTFTPTYTVYIDTNGITAAAP